VLLSLYADKGGLRAQVSIYWLGKQACTSSIPVGWVIQSPAAAWHCQCRLLGTAAIALVAGPQARGWYRCSLKALA
jgi:hypothetical protein